MYFAKTPGFKAEPDSESDLREKIANQRQELYNALRLAGIKDPPVELRVEAFEPRADCIFFEFRDGLKNNSYDYKTFAEAYTSYSWDSLTRVKQEAEQEFQRCQV